MAIKMEKKQRKLKMQIAHVALWTRDLDTCTDFWSSYFDCTVTDEYVSQNRHGFRSRFIKMPEGPSIELMTGPWLGIENISAIDRIGWAHIAISLGSEDAVRTLAKRFEMDGLLISHPRFTGDGFYEAVAKSSDGILVEITS